jgi:uncharacterized protein (DUF362 family)
MVFLFDFEAYICKNFIGYHRAKDQEDLMQKVMIRPASYHVCREAIDRAFELFPLNVKNQKVLVKPNAVMASDPDEAIVTHPAVIRAIVEKLESLDPSEIIVGDNPGYLGDG